MNPFLKIVPGRPAPQSGTVQFRGPQTFFTAPHPSRRLHAQPPGELHAAAATMVQACKRACDLGRPAPGHTHTHTRHLPAQLPRSQLSPGHRQACDSRQARHATTQRQCNSPTRPEPQRTAAAAATLTGQADAMQANAGAAEDPGNTKHTQGKQASSNDAGRQAGS